MRTYLAWMSSFLCLAAITGFAKSPVESCETRSLSELLTKTNILSTTPKLVLKADKCNGETCTFYYSFENDNVLQVEILKGDSATICEGQLKEHEPPAETVPECKYKALSKTYSLQNVRSKQMYIVDIMWAEDRTKDPTECWGYAEATTQEPDGSYVIRSQTYSIDNYRVVTGMPAIE